MSLSKEMLVIVPTRDRPHNIDNFYKSFIENSEISDLCIVVDNDQKDLYEYKEKVIFEYLPKSSLVKKLNSVSIKYATRYKYICFAGDDVIIKTRGWDTMLTQPLKNNPGMSYGNDLIQGQGLPNVPVVSSEIIRALEFFAPWDLEHYYMDNFIKKLAEDIDSIYYFENVILEHMHPMTQKASSDSLYDNTYHSYYRKDSRFWTIYCKQKYNEDLNKVKDFLKPKRNGIVYSFYVREDRLIDNFCYKQLLYSLTTLRKYNKDIPVKVCIAPSNIDKENNKLLDFENLEIIQFDSNYPNTLYKSWIDLGYAEFLYHRWQNAFATLRHFSFDNILYLDTDTIFYKDPEILFKKYGNSNYVWAREDNSGVAMKGLGLVNAMNDGQFILSKNLLEHEKQFTSHSINYINRTLTNSKEIFDEKEYRNIHWLMVQYAAFDYFKSIQRPVQYFDSFEVMLHVEPEYKETSNLVLQHYFNGNTTKFVPKEFLE